MAEPPSVYTGSVKDRVGMFEEISDTSHAWELRSAYRQYAGEVAKWRGSGKRTDFYSPKGWGNGKRDTNTPRRINENEPPLRAPPYQQPKSSYHTLPNRTSPTHLMHHPQLPVDHMQPRNDASSQPDVDYRRYEDDRTTPQSRYRRPNSSGGANADKPTANYHRDQNAKTHWERFNEEHESRRTPSAVPLNQRHENRPTASGRQSATIDNGVASIRRRIKAYPYKTKPAKALVVCVSTFETMEPLRGYEKDLSALKSVFEKYNIDGFFLQNGTADEIKFFVKKFPEKFSGDEYFCALFFLSHGGQRDEIYGYDGKSVKINDILKGFDNTCRQLQDMPKLFFFQCCRGFTSCQGVPTGGDVVAGPGFENLLPKISDTLVAFSTLQDDVSIVNNSSGSWFIQALTRVWAELGHMEHMLDLMTIVNDEVADMQTDPADVGLECTKVISDFKTNLRRRLYLRPQRQGRPTDV